MIKAALLALSAFFQVWKQERSIRNSPDIVKNKIDIAKQEARDAIRHAEATLANPSATPQDHAEALRQIRLAGS